MPSRTPTAWRPREEHLESVTTSALAPHAVIVWNRAAWRVLARRPLEHTRWLRLQAHCHRSRLDRDTRARRPLVLDLIRDHGTETFERVLASPGHVWQVMPEHYAVCRRCAELPPCAHETRESEVDAETARLEDLLRMTPGDCLGCGLPITDRMRYTRFPGPNLWRPDLPDDSAVVHARAACRPWAQKYHRAWASIVAPTRSR